jgi:hypothetical protein
LFAHFNSAFLLAFILQPFRSVPAAYRLGPIRGWSFVKYADLVGRHPDGFAISPKCQGSAANAVIFNDLGDCLAQSL